MRNLYIVNTPLHLFTAYILANYYTAGQKNVLALINPKGYSSWANSHCLTKMHNDNTTWEYSIVGTKDYLRARLKSIGPWGILTEFKEKLNYSGSIDQVYLAQDKMLANQIIVEMTGNTTYIRFDEGTASYVLPPKRRAKSKMAEYLTVQALRMFAGLHSAMKYNFDGIGQGEAATADYLFKPHMLERSSPNPIAIERAAIVQALDKLIPVMNDYEELNTGTIIIYLGSQLSDRGKLNREAELRLLHSLAAMANEMNYKLLYKPHPGEIQEKLIYYSEQLPGMKFFYSVEPMEIILYRYSNIKALVTALHSSAILYADLFAREKICTISAIDLLGSKPQPIDYLIQRAGVKTPKDLDEMHQMLSNI